MDHFSLLLILVAVFPDPMFWLAELWASVSGKYGISLCYLYPLIKTFNLTLEISQLQYKIQELVQKIALDENKKNKSGQGGKMSKVSVIVPVYNVEQYKTMSEKYSGSELAGF